MDHGRQAVGVHRDGEKVAVPIETRCVIRRQRTVLREATDCVPLVVTADTVD